jgi:serine/threonine protein kinase
MDGSALAHMERLLREDVAGEFEVHSLLGRGGMAVVYLATEVHLSRKVAIKVLPPELTFGHGVDRFMREAKTAAALDHPSIIPIYRVASGGKIFWYAMKFLEGRSLEDVIKEKKVVPLADTIDILTQVADALDYAHAHSVIHRDIKPANVMLDARNRVIVTDFGIAKALTERTLTASGSVVGTPYYMSPEQGMGKGVSGRSDQYSVAVMAFRMLSGQVPFEGDSAIDILHKQVMVPPPLLESLAPGLPPHVYAAVHKALEKKPEARFASVTTFVDALAGRVPIETAPDQSSDAATVALPSSQASIAAARSAALPTTKRPAQPPAAAKPGPKPSPKRSPWKTVVATLAVAAIAGGALGVWWLKQQPASTLAAGATTQTASTTPASTTRQQPAQEPAAQPGTQQPNQPASEAPAAEREQAPEAVAAKASVPTASTAAPATAKPAATKTSSPPKQPPSAPARQPAQAPARTAPPVSEPALPDDRPTRPGTGLLVIEGLPRPHRLWVDERPRLQARLELPAGSHTIRVAAPREPVFEIHVDMPAGELTLVTYGRQGVRTSGPPAGAPAAASAAAIAILQMRITPWANVTADGVNLGSKNLLIDTLIPGTHRFVFEREGFVTKDTTITLAAGPPARVLIRMVAQP